MVTATKSSEYKCPKCGYALTQAGDMNLGEMIGMWSILSPEMLKNVEVQCWKCGNRTTAADLVAAVSSKVAFAVESAPVTAQLPSAPKIPPYTTSVSPQASGEGGTTTGFQGGKKLLISGVMLLIGFLIGLIPCVGSLLDGVIAALVWTRWEKTPPANATKQGVVAGLLAGIGAFLAGVLTSYSYKNVDPASYPVSLFVGTLITLLFTLPLAILTGALTGYLISRKGKPKKGRVEQIEVVKSASTPVSNQTPPPLPTPVQGDPTELLKTIFTSQNGMVVLEAAASVEKMGWKPGNDETGARYLLTMPFNTQKWDRCVEIGAPAVKPLLAEFRNCSTWTDKASAAEALSKIAPQLEDGETRQLVLETFLNVIAEASGFDNSATLFSGNMADMWNDDKLKVYIAVAQALGVLADKRAVEPLIAGLKSKQAPRLHDTILEALVRLGASSVEPLLAVLKSNEDSEVRKHAVDALKKLGWQPGPAGKLDEKPAQPPISPAVVHILASWKSPDTATRMITLAQAGVLLAKNEPGALEPFLVALRDEEQLVRMTVLCLLWKLDKNMLTTALKSSPKADEFRSRVKELADGASLESNDAKRVLAIFNNDE